MVLQATPSVIDDDAAMKALEQLEKLDQKLGVNCGAQKERAKLNQILSEWEKKQQQEIEMDDDDDDDDDGVEDETRQQQQHHNHVGVVIERHSASDRVAVFGGDPARRRRQIEKRFRPYQKLDHFGTPRDAGANDVTKLNQRIRSGSYDVVYVWTRFGCHASRRKIKAACSYTDGDTRFVEIESLSSI